MLYLTIAGCIFLGHEAEHIFVGYLKLKVNYSSLTIVQHIYSKVNILQDIFFSSISPTLVVISVPLYVIGMCAQSCLTVVTLWTVACQASLSIGFSRQEYS